MVRKTLSLCTLRLIFPQQPLLSIYVPLTVEHRLTGCLYPHLLCLMIFCLCVCPALCRLRPQREARRFDSYGYSAESNGSTDVVQTADKCV